eukprot:4852513-Amphidinium_carterae.1
MHTLHPWTSPWQPVVLELLPSASHPTFGQTESLLHGHGTTNSHQTTTWGYNFGSTTSTTFGKNKATGQEPPFLHKAAHLLFANIPRKAVAPPPRYSPMGRPELFNQSEGYDVRILVCIDILIHIPVRGDND